MPPTQLTGSAPSASTVPARPAKPRPPWRSVQAVARATGGDPDDSLMPEWTAPVAKASVSTDVKVQPHPGLSAQPQAAPYGPFATQPGTAVSDSVQPAQMRASHATSSSSIGPSSTSSSGPVAVATAAAAAAAASASASTDADDGERPGPGASAAVKGLSEAALSVLVMVELVQMLSGGGRQLTPEELRQTLASFEVTMQDVRQAETAGLMTEDALRGLGLQPAVRAPSPKSVSPSLSEPLSSKTAVTASGGGQPATPGGAGRSFSSFTPFWETPSVIAAGSSAGTAEGGTQGLSGLFRGFGGSATPQPQWPSGPDQGTATRVLDAAADVAAILAVGSGAAAVQARDAVGDAVYGMFPPPAPRAAEGDGTSGDGGVGGGGGGASGGSGGGRSGGGHGQGDANGPGDGESGASGPDWRPRLDKMLQLLATVCLLLPPDRQLVLARQLFGLLMNAVRDLDVGVVSSSAVVVAARARPGPAPPTAAYAWAPVPAQQHPPPQLSKAVPSLASATIPSGFGSASHHAFASVPVLCMSSDPRFMSEERPSLPGETLVSQFIDRPLLPDPAAARAHGSSTQRDVTTVTGSQDGCGQGAFVAVPGQPTWMPRPYDTPPGPRPFPASHLRMLAASVPPLSHPTWQSSDSDSGESTPPTAPSPPPAPPPFASGNTISLTRTLSGLSRSFAASLSVPAPLAATTSPSAPDASVLPSGGDLIPPSPQCGAASPGQEALGPERSTLTLVLDSRRTTQESDPDVSAATVGALSLLHARYQHHQARPLHSPGPGPGLAQVGGREACSVVDHLQASGASTADSSGWHQTASGVTQVDDGRASEAAAALLPACKDTLNRSLVLQSETDLLLDQTHTPGGASSAIGAGGDAASSACSQRQPLPSQHAGGTKSLAAAGAAAAASVLAPLRLRPSVDALLSESTASQPPDTTPETPLCDRRPTPPRQRLRGVASGSSRDRSDSGVQASGLAGGAAGERSLVRSSCPYPGEWRSEGAPLGLGGGGLFMRRSLGNDQVVVASRFPVTPVTCPAVRRSTSPALSPPPDHLEPLLLQLPAIDTATGSPTAAAVSSSPSPLAAPLDATSLATAAVASNGSLASSRAGSSGGGGEGWSPKRVATTATLVTVPALAATAWAAWTSSLSPICAGTSGGDALALPTAAVATLARSGVDALAAASSGISSGGGASSCASSSLWPTSSMAMWATVTAALVALPFVAAAFFTGGSNNGSGRSPGHIADAGPSSTTAVAAAAAADHAEVAGGNTSHGPHATTHRTSSYSAFAQSLAAALGMAAATRAAAWRRLHTSVSMRRIPWTDPGDGSFGAGADLFAHGTATAAAPAAGSSSALLPAWASPARSGLAEVLRSPTPRSPALERLCSPRASELLPVGTLAHNVDYRHGPIIALQPFAAASSAAMVPPPEGRWLPSEAPPRGAAAAAALALLEDMPSPAISTNRQAAAAHRVVGDGVDDGIGALEGVDVARLSPVEDLPSFGPLQVTSSGSAASELDEEWQRLHAVMQEIAAAPEHGGRDPVVGQLSGGGYARDTPVSSVHPTGSSLIGWGPASGSWVPLRCPWGSNSTGGAAAAQNFATGTAASSSSAHVAVGLVEVLHQQPTHSSALQLLPGSRRLSLQVPRQEDGRRVSVEYRTALRSHPHPKALSAPPTGVAISASRFSGNASSAAPGGFSVAELGKGHSPVLLEATGVAGRLPSTAPSPLGEAPSSQPGGLALVLQEQPQHPLQRGPHPELLRLTGGGVFDPLQQQQQLLYEPRLTGTVDTSLIAVAYRSASPAPVPSVVNDEPTTARAAPFAAPSPQEAVVITEPGCPRDDPASSRLGAAVVDPTGAGFALVASAPVPDLSSADQDSSRLLPVQGLAAVLSSPATYSSGSHPPQLSLGPAAVPGTDAGTDVRQGDVNAARCLLADAADDLMPGCTAEGSQKALAGVGSEVEGAEVALPADTAMPTASAYPAITAAALSAVKPAPLPAVQAAAAATPVATPHARGGSPLPVDPHLLPARSSSEHLSSPPSACFNAAPEAQVSTSPAVEPRLFPEKQAATSPEAQALLSPAAPAIRSSPEPVSFALLDTLETEEDTSSVVLGSAVLSSGEQAAVAVVAGAAAVPQLAAGEQLPSVMLSESLNAGEVLSVVAMVVTERLLDVDEELFAVAAVEPMEVPVVPPTVEPADAGEDPAALPSVPSAEGPGGGCPPAFAPSALTHVAGLAANRAVAPGDEPTPPPVGLEAASESPGAVCGPEWLSTPSSLPAADAMCETSGVVSPGSPVLATAELTLQAEEVAVTAGLLAASSGSSESGEGLHEVTDAPWAALGARRGTELPPALLFACSDASAGDTTDDLGVPSAVLVATDPSVVAVPGAVTASGAVPVTAAYALVSDVADELAEELLMAAVATAALFAAPQPSPVPGSAASSGLGNEGRDILAAVRSDVAAAAILAAQAEVAALLGAMGSEGAMAVPFQGAMPTPPVATSGREGAGVASQDPLVLTAPAPVHEGGEQSAECVPGAVAAPVVVGSWRAAAATVAAPLGHLMDPAADDMVLFATLPTSPVSDAMASSAGEGSLRTSPDHPGMLAAPSSPARDQTATTAWLAPGLEPETTEQEQVPSPMIPAPGVAGVAATAGPVPAVKEGIVGDALLSAPGHLPRCNAEPESRQGLDQVLQQAATGAAAGAIAESWKAAGSADWPLAPTGAAPAGLATLSLLASPPPPSALMAAAEPSPASHHLSAAAAPADAALTPALASPMLSSGPDAPEARVCSRLLPTGSDSPARPFRSSEDSASGDSDEPHELPRVRREDHEAELPRLSPCEPHEVLATALANVPTGPTATYCGNVPRPVRTHSGIPKPPLACAPSTAASRVSRSLSKLPLPPSAAPPSAPAPGASSPFATTIATTPPLKATPDGRSAPISQTSSYSSSTRLPGPSPAESFSSSTAGSVGGPKGIRPQHSVRNTFAAFGSTLSSAATSSRSDASSRASAATAGAAAATTRKATAASASASAGRLLPRPPLPRTVSSTSKAAGSGPSHGSAPAAVSVSTSAGGSGSTAVCGSGASVSPLVFGTAAGPTAARLSGGGARTDSARASPLAALPAEPAATTGVRAMARAFEQRAAGYGVVCPSSGGSDAAALAETRPVRAASASDAGPSLGPRVRLLGHLPPTSTRADACAVVTAPLPSCGPPIRRTSADAYDSGSGDEGFGAPHLPQPPCAQLVAVGGTASSVPSPIVSARTSTAGAASGAMAAGTGAAGEPSALSSPMQPLGSAANVRSGSLTPIIAAASPSYNPAVTPTSGATARRPGVPYMSPVHPTAVPRATRPSPPLPPRPVTRTPPPPPVPPPPPGSPRSALASYRPAAHFAPRTVASPGTSETESLVSPKSLSLRAQDLSLRLNTSVSSGSSRAAAAATASSATGSPAVHCVRNADGVVSRAAAALESRTATQAALGHDSAPLPTLAPRQQVLSGRPSDSGHAPPSTYVAALPPPPTGLEAAPPASATLPPPAAVDALTAATAAQGGDTAVPPSMHHLEATHDTSPPHRPLSPTTDMSTGEEQDPRTVYPLVAELTVSPQLGVTRAAGRTAAPRPGSLAGRGAYGSSASPAVSTAMSADPCARSPARRGLALALAREGEGDQDSDIVEMGSCNVTAIEEESARSSPGCGYQKLVERPEATDEVPQQQMLLRYDADADTEGDGEGRRASAAPGTAADACDISVELGEGEEADDEGGADDGQETEDEVEGGVRRQAQKEPELAAVLAVAASSFRASPAAAAGDGLGEVQGAAGGGPSGAAPTSSDDKSGSHPGRLSASTLASRWSHALKAVVQRRASAEGGRTSGTGATPPGGAVSSGGGGSAALARQPHQADLASSVAMSAPEAGSGGGFGQLPGRDGAPGLDAVSLAGTSMTHVTHRSVPLPSTSAADAAAVDDSTASRASARRRKTLWRRMQRKLGKLMGLIPRSWELEAQHGGPAAPAGAAGTTALPRVRASHEVPGSNPPGSPRQPVRSASDAGLARH